MRKLFSLLTMGAVVLGLSLPAMAQDKPKQDLDAQFKRLDKNGDGKLTQEEFIGRRSGEMAEKAKQQFTRLDKDKSGDLSLEEFKARQRKAK